MQSSQHDAQQPKQSWEFNEQGEHFRIHSLHWDDHERHAAYQAISFCCLTRPI